MTREEIIKNFHWGPVVASHSVGEYLVIEYHPQIFKNCSGTGQYEGTITHFHPYVDAKDGHNSYVTLDQALIGVICDKHDGVNTRAPGYIFSMLKMED